MKEPGGKFSVLIADDTASLRILLKRQLQEAGFKVLEAKNGKECIEIASAEKPDIILSDFTMPEMNGLDAVSLIKKKPEISHIPVVILSSFPMGKELIQRMQLSGISGYFMKPYEFEELLTCINEILTEEKTVFETPGKDSSERRKHKRHKSTSIVDIECKQSSFVARVLNVSREGLSVILPFKLDLGSILKIGFHQRFWSGPQNQFVRFRGKARLVWLNPEKKGEGFECGLEVLSMNAV